MGYLVLVLYLCNAAAAKATEASPGEQKVQSAFSTPSTSTTMSRLTRGSAALEIRSPSGEHVLDRNTREMIPVDKTGETKQATLATDDEEEEVPDSITISFASRLYSHYQKVPLLRRIFSFHKTKNPKDYVNLRSSSKLLCKVLQPPPLWTTFPSSDYTTLQSFLNRLTSLHSEESSNMPSVIFIEEGEHGGEDVHFQIPLSIIGAGRGKTTLRFCLKIEGKKSNGLVVIEDLKIKEGGLEAYAGMNVVMRRCTVEECAYSGVSAYKADVTCDDLQVIGCGGSGVLAEDTHTIKLINCEIKECNGSGIESRGTGVIKLINCEIKECNGSGIESRGTGVIDILGEKTNIHHNNGGNSRNFYGVLAVDFSVIRIHAPLQENCIYENNFIEPPDEYPSSEDSYTANRTDDQDDEDQYDWYGAVCLVDEADNCTRALYQYCRTGESEDMYNTVSTYEQVTSVWESLLQKCFRLWAQEADVEAQEADVDAYQSGDEYAQWDMCDREGYIYTKGYFNRYHNRYQYDAPPGWWDSQFSCDIYDGIPWSRYSRTSVN